MYRGITTALIVFVMAMPGIVLADAHGGDVLHDSSGKMHELEQQFLHDDSMHKDDMHNDGVVHEDGTVHMHDGTVDGHEHDMLNDIDKKVHDDMQHDLHHDMNKDLGNDVHDHLDEPTHDGVKDSLY